MNANVECTIEPKEELFGAEVEQRAKSMIQTGRRERVPSHLFLIVFYAILLANHVTITGEKMKRNCNEMKKLHCKT